MRTVTDNNGVQLANYDWDSLSRRDQVALNNGSLATDLVYENDNDLQSMSQLTGPQPVSFTFGRNNSGQITATTASDGAFLSRPAVTKSDTYVANKLNQISTLNGGTLSYDLNGNLTGDGTWTFEYDEENRLRTANKAGVSVIYEYDPLGRRRPEPQQTCLNGGERGRWCPGEDTKSFRRLLILQ